MLCGPGSLWTHDCLFLAFLVLNCRYVPPWPTSTDFLWFISGVLPFLGGGCMPNCLGSKLAFYLFTLDLQVQFLSILLFFWSLFLEMRILVFILQRRNEKPVPFNRPPTWKLQIIYPGKNGAFLMNPLLWELITPRLQSNFLSYLFLVPSWILFVQLSFFFIFYCPVWLFTIKVEVTVDGAQGLN